MKKPIQIVISLIAVLLTASAVQADAYYHGFVNGILSIGNIDTHSYFLSGTRAGDGLGVPGFTITVDPSFMDPTLRVTRETVADGYGDYSAASAANVTLFASDPFNISVGESLKAFARATGHAKRTVESRAESSAAARASLYFVNESDTEVAVDALWSTEVSRYALYSGPDGEHAGSGFGVEPGPVYWTTPLIFQIAAGEVQELPISAGASGYAFAPAAVPEPSSMFIWTLGLIVAGVTVWRRSLCQIPSGPYIHGG